MGYNEKLVKTINEILDVLGLADSDYTITIEENHGGKEEDWRDRLIYKGNGVWVTPDGERVYDWELGDDDADEEDDDMDCEYDDEDWDDDCADEDDLEEDEEDGDPSDSDRDGGGFCVVRGTNYDTRDKHTAFISVHANMKLGGGTETMFDITSADAASFLLDAYANVIASMLPGFDRDALVDELDRVALKVQLSHIAGKMPKNER